MFWSPTAPLRSPRRALFPFIDAANRGFTPEWYRKLGGDLDTVKRSIALAAEYCHVEVTTLLVPGENDRVQEIRALPQWPASVNMVSDDGQVAHVGGSSVPPG